MMYNLDNNNRLGLNVALTHHNSLNRSYRDNETKKNVEAQKRKQRRRNDRKRTSTTKNKNNLELNDDLLKFMFSGIHVTLN